MHATVQLQCSGRSFPAPTIRTVVSGESRAFEVIEIRDRDTSFDLFLGWDDISAIAQAQGLIEVFQEAQRRAQHRLALRDLDATTTAGAKWDVADHSGLRGEPDRASS